MLDGWPIRVLLHSPWPLPSVLFVAWLLLRACLFSPRNLTRPRQGHVSIPLPIGTRAGAVPLEAAGRGPLAAPIWQPSYASPTRLWGNLESSAGKFRHLQPAAFKQSGANSDTAAQGCTRSGRLQSSEVKP